MTPGRGSERREDSQHSGVPDDGDYQDAVLRHAKYLGIDPEKDEAHLWIAEEVWALAGLLLRYR